MNDKTEILDILKRIEHEYIIGNSESELYEIMNTKYSDGGWATSGPTVHIGGRFFRIMFRIDPERK